VVTLFQSLYTLSLVAGERVSGRMTSLKEEKGASAVEYALLVGLIAAAVVAAVALFSDKLSALFTNIDTHDPNAG
jgi:pilus assembly protein Flp/PilA